jgi:hypothetical protein
MALLSNSSAVGSGARPAAASLVFTRREGHDAAARLAAATG